MRRPAIIFASIVLVTSACIGPSDALVIGAIYPTRGSQASGGLEEYRGVELAAELVNRRGDAPRVRVDLEIAETREQAPRAVERLNERGIDIVVGSYGSTISRPAASAASRLGLVFWETGAVGNLDMGAGLGESVFRVPASGRDLGREAVAFVRDQLKIGADARYAVAYVDDDYGRSVGGGALAEIKRSKLVLGAEFPYDLRDADYDAIARELKTKQIDAFVVAAYLEDGTELRRAVVRNDVKLAANIGTSSSYCHRAFGEILGPQAVGVFASDKPDGDVVNTDALDADAAKALRWARETYRARFDEPMPSAALSGFAGGWALFAHVLPRARRFDAAGVARAARAIRLPPGALPNGSGLEFANPEDPEPGSNQLAASVIWEWVAPRERAIVWPPAFATHKIVTPG